jgi:hypothetical protein
MLPCDISLLLSAVVGRSLRRRHCSRHGPYIALLCDCGRRQNAEGNTYLRASNRYFGYRLRLSSVAPAGMVRSPARATRGSRAARFGRALRGYLAARKLHRCRPCERQFRHLRSRLTGACEEFIASSGSLCLSVSLPVESLPVESLLCMCCMLCQRCDGWL